MNPEHPHDRAWSRLSRAAADAPAPVEETSIPYGFITRLLAARAGQPQESRWSAHEQFIWRSAFIALLFTLGAIAFQYQELAGLVTGESLLSGSLVEVLVNPQ